MHNVTPEHGFAGRDPSDHQAPHLILIVDDDPFIVKLLDAMLTRAGYVVAKADSGHTALEILDDLWPDLILLDIDMPGMSGLETCEAIKRKPRTADVPIIFVTASADKDIIVAGFSAGAQDYIVKPSTKEELLARVRTHLALRKTQLELRASETRYRQLAFLDGLTGFYNTRYLYETLQAQLDTDPARGAAVIFTDIDKFKSVVDSHGHLNASRTIAEMAAAIRLLLPEGSYAVSYGGDEFVIVLTDHDRNAGALVAEQIRAAIESRSFLTTQGLAIRLTISCGVADYPGDARTLIDLLANADHALFETKRNGGNAVVSFAAMSARP